MRNKKLLFDINGAVTQRILDSLSALDQAELKKLRTSDALRGGVFSEKSLKIDRIDEYATATGKTLCWYFYGEQNPEITYSVDDLKIIRFLDYLPDKDLQALFALIQNFFPNKRWNSNQDIAPYILINERLNEMPYGTVNETANSQSDIIGDGTKKYFTDFRADLREYIRMNYTYNNVYSIDVMPDLATFVGVSLHWLFNFAQPLYCRTQLADLIFDYYTLMQPVQQKAFVNLVFNTIKLQQEELARLFGGNG